MSDATMTHLAPGAVWSGGVNIDDPTTGFVVFAGAILLGALLLVAKRSNLSVARIRRQA